MISDRIGHFTVMDGSEGEGDLVLIQTFFLFYFFFINRDLYYHYNTYNTFTTKFKVTKNYN